MWGLIAALQKVVSMPSVLQALYTAYEEHVRYRRELDKKVLQWDDFLLVLATGKTPLQHSAEQYILQELN